MTTRRSTDQPTVLVVDDEQDIRRMLQVTLEHSQYHVLTASDGVEAIEMLEHRTPHAILLDMDMPRLSGEGTALKLRSHPQWQLIPIIVLSGFSSFEDQQLMATLGVSAYLCKPCSPEELVDALQRVIAAAPAARRQPASH